MPPAGPNLALDKAGLVDYIASPLVVSNKFKEDTMFINSLARQVGMTFGGFLENFIYWASNRNMKIEYYSEDDIHKAMLLFVKEKEKNVQVASV